VKLALIVPAGFDRGGRAGVIPALIGLAKELGSRHEVHVFAASGPGPITHYPLLGVEVHQIGDPWLPEPVGLARRSLDLARLGYRLMRELDHASTATGFDVFHAFWAAGPGLLAGLAGRRRRVPVVVSVGGGEAVWLPEVNYGGAGSLLGRARTGAALRLADEITTGSSFARSFLTGDAAARAHVIPLGVDCQKFIASPVRPPGPPWRLLHVGSLNRVKDQHTLLMAFSDVISRVGDVWLDLVGEDTLAGQIQAQAHALGIAHRVSFRGLQSQEALRPFYRAAHVLVLSSRYESQGVVILEAAAAGVPTVGTAVGLLPTLAPEAGSSVPPGDSGALAREICGLLLDDAKRQAQGTAAQVFAMAHDVAWTAGAFEDLYLQLRRRFAGRQGRLSRDVFGRLF
jgi:glycosyltransferase involved in cell wall biosynthesis